MIRFLSRSLLSVVLATTLGVAQGSFVNFEFAPVRPLALARLTGHDWLLVCNTADDSVEVYDTVGLRFVARLPVGLRPVSVTWNPKTSTFYTANALGDSITECLLARVPGRPDPIATVLRTRHVGDEPTDVAVVPGGDALVVTLAGESTHAWLDAATLVADLEAGPPRAELGDPYGAELPKRALAEPRRILFHDHNMVALGHKGGNDPKTYDFDALAVDLRTGASRAIGGLGSANFDAQFDSAGRLFVVGWLARNEVEGEAALRAEPTGFVQSRLFMLRDVHDAQQTVETRDLHRRPKGSVVPRGEAVAGPTALALFEPSGSLEKVFVAGFSSDRIGVLQARGESLTRWAMRVIDLPVRADAGYSRSGPRGLVLKTPAPGAPGDPGHRLYVLCWLDATVRAIDPFDEREVARVALRNDPTPGKIRSGRRLLYSAELSGNGFVSCASCHVDGRTDRLAWNLGDVGSTSGQRAPADLIDGVGGVPLPTTQPDDKGFLTTQTLQKLADDVVGGSGRVWFDNAPYHWRGDRAGFTDFNAAYVSLMGAPNVGTEEQPRGVTHGEMEDFRQMVETIALPPNPEQPLARVYSGSFGTPDQPTGNGAQRGMKVFHTQALPGPGTGGRSCVQCHTLPDGSNGRLTLSTGQSLLESSPLRGLRAKEAWLERSAWSDSPTRIAAVGLTHRGALASGEPLSINDFVARLGLSLGVFPDPKVGQLVDLVQFVREFDTGTAPVVGRALTVDPAAKSRASTAQTLELLESQVRVANAGLAVWVRTPDLDVGLWFDVSHDPPAYRTVDGAIAVSREQLLELVRGPIDRLCFQATSVGGARRHASRTGDPAEFDGPEPDEITLEPMRPSTAWRDVPRLVANVDPHDPATPFSWDAPDGRGGMAEEPKTLIAMRVFQRVLSESAMDVGVDGLRHDAPRRFRVAARNLRPGALLVLGVPADASRTPPYPSGGPVLTLEMPLFPTDERTPDGRVIWETTAEAEPRIAHALLMGGPYAPGVADALAGRITDSPSEATFAPDRWNLHLVAVRNADGTLGQGGWQSLRFAPAVD